MISAFTAAPILIFLLGILSSELCQQHGSLFGILIAA